MGALKWIIILAGDFLLPPPGIPLFSILYFTWKYIKIKIKLDIYTTYFLFIGLPQIVVFGTIHLLGLASKETMQLLEKPFDALMSGIHVIEEYPKRSGVMMAFFGIFAFMFSTFSISGGAGSLLAGNFFSLLWLLGFTFLPSILLAAIWAKISGFDFKKAATGEMRRAGEMHRDVKGDVKGVYKDVQKRQDKAESGSWMPGNVVTVMKSIKELVPLFGKAATTKAAEAKAAEVATDAATKVKNVSLLPLIIVAAIVLLFQLAIIMVLFAGAVNVYLPMVLGPMMEAAGLGAAYGDYVGQTVGNQALAGIDLTEEKRALGEAGARVKCILKGPSCLRQWRLNNTVRPGSEDVGETYGLKIDRFEVGQGKTVNIAFKEESYALPISFTISNPRHGLKGIDARNVRYRLKMIDLDNQGEDAYCDTGWVPVGAYDIDGDGRQDDIYPGTSASTGFLTLRSGDDIDGDGESDVQDGFTLKDCNMLQPALGEYRTVMLEVRYDYFSQATLYFQGMSRENLQSNPDIQKSWEESRTADTPVKAAVNVNAPVLFYSSPEGGLEAQPFGVRATVNTDKYDLRYKVKDMVIRKSSRTSVVEDSGQECQFEPSDGENMYGLIQEARQNIIAEDMRERIESVESDLSESQVEQSLWFNRNKEPPIFGCVMELTDLSTISPAGETLNMNIKANYTVAKSEKIDNFRLYNSRCSSVDCPLLVTEQFDESSDYDWKTECTGVDAGNGCNIVRGDGDWSTITLTNDNFDRHIEQGEVALRAKMLDELDSVDDVDDTTEKNEDTVYLSAGLEKRNWEKIEEDDEDYAIVWDEDFQGRAETSYYEIDLYNLCSNVDVSLTQRTKWLQAAKGYLESEDGRGWEDVVSLVVHTNDLSQDTQRVCS